MLKSRSRCRMQWSDIVLWLEGLPTEIHCWSSNWIEGNGVILFCVWKDFQPSWFSNWIEWNGVILFCDWQDFQFRFTVGPPTGSNEMEWSGFVIGMTSNWDSQLVLQLDRMKSSLQYPFAKPNNYLIVAALYIRNSWFFSLSFDFFIASSISWQFEPTLPVRCVALIVVLQTDRWRGVEQKLIRQVNYKAAGTVIDLMAINQFFLQRRYGKCCGCYCLLFIC
jgi:hypothetical protein